MKRAGGSSASTSAPPFDTWEAGTGSSESHKTSRQPLNGPGNPIESFPQSRWTHGQKDAPLVDDADPGGHTTQGSTECCGGVGWICNVEMLSAPAFYTLSHRLGQLQKPLGEQSMSRQGTRGRRRQWAVPVRFQMCQLDTVAGFLQSRNHPSDKAPT